MKNATPARRLYGKNVSRFLKTAEQIHTRYGVRDTGHWRHDPHRNRVRRRLGDLPTHVRVHLGVHDKYLDVLARGENVVKPAVADVVHPSVAADACASLRDCLRQPTLRTSFFGAFPSTHVVCDRISHFRTYKQNYQL